LKCWKQVFSLEMKGKVEENLICKELEERKKTRKEKKRKKEKEKRLF
jgi:hypothetical protein